MADKEWAVILTNLYGVNGGIPAFNRELVEALREIARKGQWRLRVLVLKDSDRQTAPSKDFDYEAFGGNRWRFSLASLRALWRAKRVLLGHVHLAPLSLFPSRAECWMVAHGIEVWGPLSLLRRLGMRRVNRILCVSRYTRDKLIGIHHVKKQRTVIFPNTARLASSERLEDPLTLRRGASHLFFTLSRLWPEERYKNIDRVIDAMPAVLAATPNALYVIAGDGRDRARLEKRVRDLGVEQHVFFAGAISEERAKAYYNACDVFVLPSLGEGFGIVFLEAMASGKPCVGARAGAIPEVIQDGKTGLLVKPDDTLSIARALIRLLRDPPLRQAMGQAGRERFESEYSIAHFHQRLAKLSEEAA